MRKLLFVLIGLFAVITMIRAYTFTKDAPLQAAAAITEIETENNL